MTRWMVAALLAVSVPVLAQTQAPQRSKQGPAAPRVTTLSFEEGDLIDAAAEGPEYQVFDTRPEIQHPGLIRVRTDFDQEVLRSVEQL